MTTYSQRATSTFPIWKPVLFFCILIVGLYWVKWDPYYHKAFIAADTHNIGTSILNDQYQSAWQAMWQYSKVYFLAIWKAALLGLVIGSLMPILIPKDWFIRLLGQTKFSHLLAGTLVSLPGMMCTCCAAPVAVGLRKSSASTGASVAFWLANPVLNPATLIFMGFVLGIEFTLIRLIAGIAMVLTTAYLVQKWGNNPSNQQLQEQRLPVQQQQDDRPLLTQWLQTFWRLFLNTVPVYIITVLALSFARIWLFPHAHGIFDNHFIWLLFFAIAGTLFVIPTAAEIPIIQTLITFGISTSSAFALLMTLPTVSLPSLLMMKPVLSTRSLLIIATCVMLTGLLIGLMTQIIF